MPDKRKRQKREHRGQCVKCGKTPVVAGHRCAECREKHLKYMREGYAERRLEIVRAERESRTCLRCGSARPSWGYTCDTCRMALRVEAIAVANQKARERHRDPKVREQVKRRIAKTKAMVYDKYGGKCVHCGEDRPEVLTLDHVNNDGHKDKMPNGKRRPVIYTKVLAAGCPPTFQLLCRTCNWLKHARGGTLDA